MYEKENSSGHSNFEESEVKKAMFDSLKRSGVLDGLKSQLRGKLYDQLKMKNEVHRPSQRETANKLTFKFAISLVSDLM